MYSNIKKQVSRIVSPGQEKKRSEKRNLIRRDSEVGPQPLPLLGIVAAPESGFLAAGCVLARHGREKQRIRSCRLAADGICGFSRRGQGGERMYVGNPQTKSVCLRDAANRSGLPVERKGVFAL